MVTLIEYPKLKWNLFIPWRLGRIWNFRENKSSSVWIFVFASCWCGWDRDSLRTSCNKSRPFTLNYHDTINGVTKPLSTEVFRNSQKTFRSFSEDFPKAGCNLPKGVPNSNRGILKNNRRSQRLRTKHDRAPTSAHMLRTDVTEGTHCQQCTALYATGL